MPNPNKFQVQIVNDNGELNETIKEVNNEIDPKKLKTRKIKTEYRNAMKVPSRFSETHVADPDHPSLIMKENEEVTFHHAVEFSIGFLPDPEIEPEIDARPTPFEVLIDGEWVQCNMPERAMDTGNNGNGKWQAGPFRMSAAAARQKYFKFIMWTKEGLILDPDIIFDL
jgi:hypothetical protein